MRFDIAKKILAGYLAGFVLLLAFAGLTLYNGMRIEATTQSLAQQKLPGLIAATDLKNGLQIQKNHLYELYATADRAAFDKQYPHDLEVMRQQLQDVRKLPEFSPHDSAIKIMVARQQALVSRFAAIMGEKEVEWDRAREGLSQFGAAADDMATELDKLVHEVETGTLNQAETSRSMTRQLMNGSLVVTGLIFLGVLAMVLFTTRHVSTPLRKMSIALGEIAANRDLTRRLEKGGDDEVGDIAAAVNNLLAEFQKLAHKLDDTAKELLLTVQTLTGVTDDTRVSVLSQNEQLHAADGAAREIASQVVEIASKAEAAAAEAGSSAQASQLGREAVMSNRESIANLAREVESTSGVIARLEQDSQQVTGVLAIIRDIADQTNLLALNAAIEAARAGESGRGFAVVADEVRKLSQSTGNATAEIDKIMVNLRRVVQDAASLMQRARNQAEASVSVAGDAETKLHTIQEAAQRILSTNHEIDAVTRDHEAQVQAIRSRMGEIAASAANTERNVDALQGAAAALSATAVSLQAEIGRIRY